MANVFKAQQKVNEHPNRNNFDLSFQNHLTMKFGTLYPVFCKEVVPGDSFRIETAFGLRFMPLVFPVQSRMRAHMHFFYVRNKNLWKNWQDWLSGLKDPNTHPHPYISGLNQSKFATSSIYDYLGVPTSLVSNDEIISFNLVGENATQVLKYRLSGDILPEVDFTSIATPVTSPVTGNSFCYVSELTEFSTVHDDYSENYGKFLVYGFSERLLQLLFANGGNFKLSFLDGDGKFLYLNDRAFVPFNFIGLSPDNYGFIIDDSSVTDIVNGGELIRMVISFNSDNRDPYVGSSPVSLFNLVSSQGGFTQYPDSGLSVYGDGSNQLKLNALPYRAYESVYNAFYRNTQNDPFVKDGEKVYNEYITNNGDGADDTDYHLFQRNYEMDFLTSSLPSPQQGVAPLVGMTALGDITIEDENGITTAHAEVDDSGTISKVVLTSPAASVDHARTAMNIASVGMNINDFRGTNALQRWLETNIRKGYRYIDFITGHFGKSPEYRELDMPEFIGGFSRDVNVGQITQTVDTYGMSGYDSGSPLGSFAGQASVLGSSEHSVSHYCDDYGFIMGILCVTPEPAYSQLLPKMYLKERPLDYYFPEFSQLGMQPVTYEEVMPLQSAVDSLSDASKRLTDTFGYQRPNYDLVANVDEVHGNFRGNLRNMVINRIFSHRPELGHEFLAIEPSEVNDIFAYTEDTQDNDPIIGQIVFKVHAKRPIPRVVIPNLGK